MGSDLLAAVIFFCLSFRNLICSFVMYSFGFRHDGKGNDMLNVHLRYHILLSLSSSSEDVSMVQVEFEAHLGPVCLPEERGRGKKGREL